MIRRLLRLGLLLIGGLMFFTGGLWFWYHHRPVPDDLSQVLFEGVAYVRDVRDEPRPLVIHIVTVNLDAPGVEFLVTPGDPDQKQSLEARKTSEFLAEFDVQVAVNGDFFAPWYFKTPWDYYPHPGDPVAPCGLAVSQGIVYSQGPEDLALYLSQDNRANLGAPSDEIYNAISGNMVLVREGRVIEQPDCSSCDALHPRTALALDRHARRLMIVVVDGRQPSYSEGVTLGELGDIILDYGGYMALNLDGGGSTTLVVEGQTGEPVVLNSPIESQIPGRERPVANHLGVYALRTDADFKTFDVVADTQR